MKYENIFQGVLKKIAFFKSFTATFECVFVYLLNKNITFLKKQCMNPSLLNRIYILGQLSL